MPVLGCGAQMSKLMDVSDQDIATIEDTIKERLGFGVSQAVAQRQAVDEAIAQLADERSMVMRAVDEQLGKQDVPEVRFGNTNDTAGQDGPKFATMDGQTQNNDANTKSTQDAQAKVKKLSTIVARALNTPEPDAAGAYRAVSLPEGGDLGTIASAFGKSAIGYQLVRVLKGKKSPFSTVGGVSTGAIPDTVFINIDSNRPHLSMLGHELAHELKRDNPTLYAEMVEAMRPYVDQSKYKAEFGKERVASDLAKAGDADGVREEFMGEVLSDGFTEPAFWNALGEKSPTLLSKVVGAVGNLIDKVRRTFGPQRRTAKYLTDFDKVMQIAGEAMARYAGDKDAAPEAEAKQDTRFSRSGKPNHTGTNWTAPENTKVDTRLQQLQDRHVDLKRFQEVINQQSAIPEGFDARLAETLYAGRVTERTESFMKNEAAPLLDAIAKAKVTTDELSDYLLARHAPERNAQIAKVNDKYPDGGAGTNSQGVLMTTQAANDHIANLSAGKRAALQLVAAKVDAITKGTTTLLVAEGLESQNTIDNWTGAYKNYVPLFKNEAEGESFAPHSTGAGYSVTGKSSKRAMGGDGVVTNMLAHVLIQREAAITRAEKNRVGMALYGLVLTNPNSDVWTTIRPQMKKADLEASLTAMGVDVAAQGDMDMAPTKQSVHPSTGKVVNITNPMYKTMDNALVVKVNGEDRVILFNEKNERAMRMASAMKNQDGITGLNLASRAVAKPTRWIASLATQYNPAFGAVNVTRDTLGALVNLSTTPIAGKQLAVLKGIKAAAIGIARDLRDDAARTPMSDLYQQFREDGAQTGFRDILRDPNEQTKRIESDLQALADGGGSAATKAAGAAKAVLELMDGFNTTLENAVRLSAYKVALDSGVSRPEAARLARELTVDFNRKGAYSSDIGALYAFFNATVQGTTRTLVSLSGPSGKKIIVGGLALGAIQAAMLAMAGYDDDEIAQFTKARAFIIPLPGKQYVQIPLPLGLNVLPNAGRILSELAISGGKDAGKQTAFAVAEMLGALNPLGGSVASGDGFLRMALPTVADPVVDIVTGKDFAGRNISKETRDGDPRPGYLLGKERTLRMPTGEAYKGIAQAINKISGGREFSKGYASPTPEEVRYTVMAVGGGLLREIEKVGNASVMTLSGKEVPAYMVPLGSRFAGEVDDAQVQTTRYYANKTKISDLKSEMDSLRKSRQPQEANKLMVEQPVARLAQMNTGIAQEISGINKMIAEQMDKPDSLQRYDAMRTRAMKRLNDRVKALEEAAN